MSILPLLPIVILLGGAATIVLCRVLRFPHYDAIAAGALGLALAALLIMAVQGFGPGETIVSSWQPVSVLGTPISLRPERSGWLISLVAVLAATAAALAGIAYPGQRRFGPRALALGMTAALVLAAFAANVLTVVMAWGVFDALFAIAALMRRGDDQAGRRAAFAVGFNTVATLSLWIAALSLNAAHESQYWHLTNLDDTAVAFVSLAAILRLGFYPFNQWLPVEQDDAPGRVALLYILPPLAGIHVLMRMAQLNVSPVAAAAVWLPAASIVAGGALAWLRSDSRDAIPYISMASLSAIVLAAFGGKPTTLPQAVLAAGAVSWAFAVMTLSLSRSFDRKMPWWTVGHALAIATLVGLPATAGYTVQTSLAAGATAGDSAVLIASIIAGQALAFAAMARLATVSPPNPPPAGRIAVSTYIAAMGLAALLPFILPALLRGRLPELLLPAFEFVLAQLGAAGVVIMILPIVLAAAIVWASRDQMPTGGRSRLAEAIRLDWLYGLSFRLVASIARLAGSITAIVEGEGAILWALLILVATYVVLSGAIQ